MGRAGKRLRDQAQRARWAFCRRNVVLLVAVSASYVAAAVVIVSLARRSSTDVALFTAGAMTTGLAWFLWAAVTEFDGQRHRFSAAIAEAETSRELRKLRRQGWTVVDDVSFERFNIDHVLVGSGGIFAIETKWTTQPWRLEGGRLNTNGLGDPARQAAAGAATVSRLLRSHARVAERVQPVIVIWGPGRPRVPDTGARLGDDVVVLEGGRCRGFFRSLDLALSPDVVAGAAEALYAFESQRDDYERRRRQRRARSSATRKARSSD